VPNVLLCIHSPLNVLSVSFLLHKQMKLCWDIDGLVT